MVSNILKNNTNGSPYRFHMFSEDSMGDHNRPWELKRAKLFAHENNNEKISDPGGNFVIGPKQSQFGKLSAH